MLAFCAVFQLGVSPSNLLFLITLARQGTLLISTHYSSSWDVTTACLYNICTQCLLDGLNFWNKIPSQLSLTPDSLLFPHGMSPRMIRFGIWGAIADKGQCHFYRVLSNICWINELMIDEKKWMKKMNQKMNRVMLIWCALVPTVVPLTGRDLCSTKERG